MNKIKLLIVGGTGFFGKSIIDYFLRDQLNKYGISELIITSRSAIKFKKLHPEFNHQSITFIDIDITKTKKLPEADLIIHAASSAKQKDYINDSKSQKENTEKGVINFLEIIKKSKNKPKIVYCSSGAVYGLQPKDIDFIKEDFTFQDVNKMNLDKREYCLSKRVAENEIIKSGKNGLNVSIARCFAFFGKYLPTNEHFAYGNFLRQAENGEDIIVNADHLVIRSYMHSDKLVDSLIKIAFSSNPSCPIFNVGSNKEISIFELADNIALKYGVNVIKKRFINNNVVDRYVPNTDKLNSLKFKINNER